MLLLLAERRVQRTNGWLAWVSSVRASHRRDVQVHLWCERTTSLALVHAIWCGRVRLRTKLTCRVHLHVLLMLLMLIEMLPLTFLLFGRPKRTCVRVSGRTVRVTRRGPLELRCFEVSRNLLLLLLLLGMGYGQGCGSIKLILVELIIVVVERGRRRGQRRVFWCAVATSRPTGRSNARRNCLPAALTTELRTGTLAIATGDNT